MDTKEAVPSPYAHWGGLPATVAALDDCEQARAQDEQLSALFAKLDLLENAPRTVTGLCDAMAACNFSKEEQDRINSPCLDGLVSACSSPFGHIKEMDQRIQIGDFFLRLAYPKPFADTLQWVLSGVAKDSAIWANLHWLLIAAGGANHVSLLEELLKHGPFMSIPVIRETELEHATLQGCLNGHVAAVRVLLDAKPDVIEQKDYLLAKALSGGYLALAQLLTEFATAHHVPIRWRYALPNAVEPGRTSILDFCFKSGGDVLQTNLLEVAFCRSISMNRVTLVPCFLAMDPTFDITSDHLQRAIQAKSPVMLQLLLDKQPDLLPMPDHSAKSLLILACRKGCIPVIDFLTAAGIAKNEFYGECLEPAVDSLDLLTLKHCLLYTSDAADE